MPVSISFPSRQIHEDVAEIVGRCTDILPQLRGKTFLITGGSGFLLSYLVDVLAYFAESSLENRLRVIVADNHKTGIAARLAHLKGLTSVSLIDVDVSKPFEIGEDPDYIVHGASIASPVTYRQFPLETAEVNAFGTYHLLKRYSATPLRGFVLMSTSEVYGDPDPAWIPTPEDYCGYVSCTGPRACYDESKRFAETLATILNRTSGVPSLMIRPFNVFGPGMRLDDQRVLPDFARAALSGRDITIFSDGRPTRSFCYITDFIVGLLQVMVNGRPGEAYNVGNDSEEISMLDLATLVAEESGDRSKVVFQASVDAKYLTDNPQRRAPSLSKLRSLGGFEIEVPLREGIRRYLAWAKESGELDRVGTT